MCMDYENRSGSCAAAFKSQWLDLLFAYVERLQIQALVRLFRAQDTGTVVSGSDTMVRCCDRAWT